MESKLFKVYSINDTYITPIKYLNGHTYKSASASQKEVAFANWLVDMEEEYEADELKEILEKKNEGYHTRIHKNSNYTFFGDIDGFPETIEKFYEYLKIVMNRYKISLEKKDFLYTKNKGKEGSYHYSIPKYNCSTEKLKEIHETLKKYIQDELKIKKESGNIIDTSIYSEHWWRLPNQHKQGKKGTEHKIIKGNMIDFIPEYIPEGSISIENNKIEVKEKKEVKKPNNKEPKIKAEKVEEPTIPEGKTYENNKFNKLSKIFDKCYKNTRFNDYGEWHETGMALKNIYGEEAFELFDYYSSKGDNYGGTEKTREKWNTFYSGNEKGLGLGTIYKKAIEDNKEEYKKIMFEESPTFTETDFAEKLYELSGDNFLYIKDKDIYELYSYNGKYWEKEHIVMRKYISNELFDYYQTLLVDVYWHSQNFETYRKQINKLKTLQMKNNIIETYKEYGVKKIEFDNKWWLLGFTNMVLDLKTHIFREYEKNDYISMTTRYDWVEPTQDELSLFLELLYKIKPHEEERNFYLKILSTCMEGKCLERFVVCNGGGGNGKGLLHDILLLALGDYGMLGNNALLFEKAKTGSNPEKANIHKKRCVIMREPPEKEKIENSIMKELTGGGKISARGHHETCSQILLNLTLLLECNKRPKFAEEPTTADIRRLIDEQFVATFTMDKELMDEENHIYLANSEYKEIEFQEKYKCAFIKILIESHKDYDPRDLKIPKSVQERSKQYLEMSCVLLDWFKQNYELTKEKNEFVSIDSIFITFKNDNEYYSNLSKQEKRKYNKQYMFEYFSNNILTKKYYKEKYSMKHTNYTNVLFGWKKKESENEESDEENPSLFNESKYCELIQ